MDISRVTASKVIRGAVACDYCTRNRSRNAVENAFLCMDCAKSVADRVLEEAGCGPLDNRPDRR